MSLKSQSLEEKFVELTTINKSQAKDYDEDDSYDPLDVMNPYKKKKNQKSNQKVNIHDLKNIYSLSKSGRDKKVKDASNNLSYKSLKSEIDKLHVRKRTPVPNTDQFTYEKLSLCADFGSEYKKKSHLDKYGIGITLFFKFVKHLTLVFLFLFVLVIPLIVLSIKGRKFGYEENLINKFVWTTLGNLGENEFQCHSVPLSQILTNVSQNLSFGYQNIECPKDKNLDEHITYLQYANLVYLGLNQIYIADNITNISYNPAKTTSDYFNGNNFTLIDPILAYNDSYNDCRRMVEYFQDKFDDKCFDTKFGCNLTIDPIVYVGDSTCIEKLSSLQQSSSTEYFMNVCLLCDRVYTFFDKSVTKDKVSGLWVLLDLTILFLLSVVFYRLDFLERKEIGRIKKENVTSSIYTIQVRNLPKLSGLELHAKLFEHFENLSPDIKIADISTGMADKQININFQIGKIKKKINIVENMMELIKDKNDNDQTEKLKKEHIDLVDQLQEIKKKLTETELHEKLARCAFVSFTTEGAAILVEHEYNKFANSNKLFRLWRRKKISQY